MICSCVRGADPGEHARTASANEAVVERLVRPVARRRVFPLKAVADHIDDAASTRRSSTRFRPRDFRNYGRNTRILLADSIGRSVIGFSFQCPRITSSQPRCSQTCKMELSDTQIGTPSVPRARLHKRVLKHC